MQRWSTVEIHKDEHQFSAGHFTVFSATEREDLHGHNYSVSVSMQVLLNDNGMAFDYRQYKQKIAALCNQLDRRFLLPSRSAYLKLEDTGDMWIAHFSNERIPFLKRDVVILDLTNVTIEELSHWFLQHLLTDNEEVKNHVIQEIIVKVYNGPGQSAAANCGHQLK